MTRIGEADRSTENNALDQTLKDARAVLLLILGDGKADAETLYAKAMGMRLESHQHVFLIETVETLWADEFLDWFDEVEGDRFAVVRTNAGISDSGPVTNLFVRGRASGSRIQRALAKVPSQAGAHV